MVIYEHIRRILLGSWAVSSEMSPYLLFGFLVAGTLSVLVSPQWVERHLGGRGLLPVLKSVLLGVPLPLCSCGVIAVGASIRNHGASRGATTGFLLATPQTGVDSILVTWGMMGPIFGIFRPLVALLTGIIGGALVDFFEGDETASAKSGKSSASCAAACCSEKEPGSRLLRALTYGFVTLPRDIARPLILGIAIAALITTLIPQDSLSRYVGGGLPAMLALIVIGIPIYVCSTASIPLALGFIHLGASPGAALAFLIAGPATNAATFLTVWRVLGRRTGIIYLGTVAIGALAAGSALDTIYSATGAAVPHAGIHDHVMEIGMGGHLWAVLLTLVLINCLWPRRTHPKMSHAEHEPKEAAAMDSLTIQVSGMTCSHCSNAVERGLRETPGVEEAAVDLKAGRVLVKGNGLDVIALCETIRRLGYGAELL